MRKQATALLQFALKNLLNPNTWDAPPRRALHPRRCRSEELIAEGAQWLADGGSLDFTVRSIKSRKALQQYHAAGLPLSRVTVSSDAFGSLPSYDSAGGLRRQGLQCMAW